LKIKTRQTVECAIIGYTPGKGDRETSFGALHLARLEGGELQYLGKVGAGFDEPSLKAVSVELQKLGRIKRSVKEKPFDHARSVWIEPKLTCEVEFASVTEDGLLREPVFVRLRPEL
jgi:bifunctional non-homologous end joining protein LigD